MERIYFEEVIQKVVENKLCKASQKILNLMKWKARN